MKKVKFITAVLIAAMLCVTVTGCFEGEEKSQGTETISKAESVVSNSASEETESSSESKNTESTAEPDNTRLGDYGIEIKDCRIEKDYTGKPAAIITYAFTNYNEDAAAFYTSVSTTVYQDGVELSESYILDDTAEYDSESQSKKIKSGVALDVEVAFELNDTETDLEVEVTEWLSFTDDKITKTFKIA